MNVDLKICMFKYFGNWSLIHQNDVELLSYYREKFIVVQQYEQFFILPPLVECYKKKKYLKILQDPPDKMTYYSIACQIMRERVSQ